jgi:hypothetical protein
MTMGDEADADWQAGLSEWGVEWTREEERRQLAARPVCTHTNTYWAGIARTCPWCGASYPRPKR